MTLWSQQKQTLAIRRGRPSSGVDLLRSMVSKATGIKMYLADVGVFGKFSSSCFLSCSARRGRCGRKISHCEGVNHSGVPGGAWSACQGTKVRRSGRLPSPFRRPVSSFMTGTSERLKVRHVRSLSSRWRVDRPLLFLHEISYVASRIRLHHTDRF